MCVHVYTCMCILRMTFEANFAFLEQLLTFALESMAYMFGSVYVNLKAKLDLVK